jgi:hypothetical protein
VLDHPGLAPPADPVQTFAGDPDPPDGADAAIDNPDDDVPPF